MDHALGAGPPARVRVPWGAVRVDRDPAVPAHEPPDEQVRIYGVPAPAHVEVQHRTEVGLEGDPDPRRGPSQVHHRLIDEMRRTSLGSAPMDPRMGPSLCTHLHIDTWLLLMGLRDLAALLSERPEK